MFSGTLTNSIKYSVTNRSHKLHANQFEFPNFDRCRSSTAIVVIHLCSFVSISMMLEAYEIGLMW